MSAPGFGIPGGGPMMGAAPMQAQTGFVLDIPADPSWEPFDAADVLDQDGYYQLKITKESGRNDANKSQGIFLTMEVQDPDARGKILSRFLPDPRTAKGNVWWIWRGLLRSITGTLDGARQGMRYQPGMFTNQLVYVKTERAMRDDRMSTDIDAWVTAPEWQEATRTNRHRWAPKPMQAGGNVGALPGGVPGGFPGLPGAGAPATLALGVGLPGAPSAALPIAQPGPGPATTPQPGGAPFAAPPPVQQAFAPPPVQQTFAPPPVQQTFAPPPGQFPMGGAPATVPAAVTDPAAPPAPGQPFSFAAFPGMGAPPPVAANGAPPPQTAAGIVSSFPVPQR
jgi:hypothetical protein